MCVLLNYQHFSFFPRFHYLAHMGCFSNLIVAALAKIELVSVVASQMPLAWHL